MTDKKNKNSLALPEATGVNPGALLSEIVLHEMDKQNAKIKDLQQQVDALTNLVKQMKVETK